MEWLWQSLGRGRQTLSAMEQGKPLARMELNLYKKETYTISGISFDGQVSEQQREAVMLGACEWFRQQQIHLLAVCPENLKAALRRLLHIPARPDGCAPAPGR